MTKVWILIKDFINNVDEYDENDEYALIGAYSTFDKAKIALENIHNNETEDDPARYMIHEVDVDC